MTEKSELEMHLIHCNNAKRLGETALKMHRKAKIKDPKAIKEITDSLKDIKKDIKATEKAIKRFE